MLTSQFKISFNLILSILSANSHKLSNSADNELITFMEKSFIQNDIIKEINNYDIIQKELQEKISMAQDVLTNPQCTTSTEILSKYVELRSKMVMITSKQRKKMNRELAILEDENKNLKKDMEKYEI